MKNLVTAAGMAAGALALIGSAHAAEAPRPLQAPVVHATPDAYTLNPRQMSAEDREISQRIISALAQSTRLRGQVINVETVGGVVRLSGTMDRVPQIYEAVAIARRVQGVRRVNDDALL